MCALPAAATAIPSSAATTKGVDASGLHVRASKNAPPALKARLQKILEDNIVPWWIKHSVDSVNGGFLLHHQDDNRYLGPNEKIIVTQARVVWFYSLLCSYPEYQTASNEAMAKHGFAFLRDKMWDKQHGGFYGEVTHEGAPTKGGKGKKLMYGQSFGLYALSPFPVWGTLDVRLGARNTAYARLTRLAGDHVFSSGSTSGLTAVWEDDPALRGPLGLVVANTYRGDASTFIYELGFNYPLDRKQALDVSFARIESKMEEGLLQGNSYDATQVRATYLYRFQ